MSNFDRNAAPWSRGYTRTGADVDQGLRAFMLGVYNHMSIGLALTGLFALGVNHAGGFRRADAISYRLASSI